MKKNHVTLTVDLGTQGHTHSLYDLSYLRLNTSYRLDLGVDSNICKVEDLKKPKISYLTLMFDLENLGQTLFCMTFHISGCKQVLGMTLNSSVVVLSTTLNSCGAIEEMIL